MTRRRGLFLPFVVTAATIAGTLLGAQLVQLTGTVRDVARILDADQARLLAESAARLKRCPPGAVALTLEGAWLEIRTAPDASRTVTVQLGSTRVIARAGAAR